LSGILHAVVHAALSQWLHEGAWAVDATVGNGYDTCFLARSVGVTGHVWGFDIQKEALERATKRLQEDNLADRVTLLHAGHEHMEALLPEEVVGHVAVVMFNLGYLPGGDKRIITRPETTRMALEQAFTILQPGGVISVVLYPGHAGGEEEAEAVRAFVEEGDGKAFMAYRFARIHTRRPAPEWFLLHKHRADL